jgi:hypothetical protein
MRTTDLSRAPIPFCICTAKESLPPQAKTWCPTQAKHLSPRRPAPSTPMVDGIWDALPTPKLTREPPGAHTPTGSTNDARGTGSCVGCQRHRIMCGHCAAGALGKKPAAPKGAVAHCTSAMPATTKTSAKTLRGLGRRDEVASSERQRLRAGRCRLSGRRSKTLLCKPNSSQAGARGRAAWASKLLAELGSWRTASPVTRNCFSRRGNTETSEFQ